MNFILIFKYIEELAMAGPDIMKAIADVLRAVNDFRAGKLTQEDCDAVVEDFKKIIGNLLGGHIATTTTTVIETTKPTV